VGIGPPETLSHTRQKINTCFLGVFCVQ
jgi:hypothetical protein